MNIIILGPQGSGKGTQAEMLRDRLGSYYFEAGKLLRQKAQTDKRLEEIVNKEGKFVPDEEMISYAEEDLRENAQDLNNLILEGFPRTIFQYRTIKNWFNGHGFGIDKAIVFEISDEEAVKRLSARRTCEKCGKVYNLVTNPPKGNLCDCGGKLYQREDDKPEAIKRRLSIYKRFTQPLVKLLDREGILIKINGERPIEVIFNEVCEKLGIERK